MSKKSKKHAIPFNVFADYSDLVMKSIFKNVADKCHSQAKELAPNGINFGPYEEFKGPPPAHPNQRCTMTPMENKMDEVKTVMHEGNIYDLDAIYLANDIGSGEGNLWTAIRLISVNPKSTHPFRVSDREGYKYITVIRSPQTFGTITPAPVPLIHGKAYTFDYGDWENVIGVYSQAGEFIGFSNYYNIHRSIDCTNIRAMAVVETLKGNGE
jgi:hypothetical protein